MSYNEESSSSDVGVHTSDIDDEANLGGVLNTLISCLENAALGGGPAGTLSGISLSHIRSMCSAIEGVHAGRQKLFFLKEQFISASQIVETQREDMTRAHDDLERLQTKLSLNEDLQRFSETLQIQQLNTLRRENESLKSEKQEKDDNITRLESELTQMRAQNEEENRESKEVKPHAGAPINQTVDSVDEEKDVPTGKKYFRTSAKSEFIRKIQMELEGLPGVLGTTSKNKVEPKRKIIIDLIESIFNTIYSDKLDFVSDSIKINDEKPFLDKVIKYLQALSYFIIVYTTDQRTPADEIEDAVQKSINSTQLLFIENENPSVESTPLKKVEDIKDITKLIEKADTASGKLVLLTYYGALLRRINNIQLQVDLELPLEHIKAELGNVEVSKCTHKTLRRKDNPATTWFGLIAPPPSFIIPNPCLNTRESYLNKICKDQILVSESFLL